MKVEAGKYYRTRDGRKVGPMKVNYGTSVKILHCVGREGDWYADNGRRSSGYERCDDLIAEWTDEFAAPKTWGNMTDAEKGALLLAHHEGKVIEVFEQDDPSLTIIAEPCWQNELCYRVRPPEPVRKSITVKGGVHPRDFWCFGNDKDEPFDKYSITFDTINGDIPTGTYTNEDGERIVVERVND